jgi:hypothetical protein
MSLANSDITTVSILSSLPPPELPPKGYNPSSAFRGSSSSPTPGPRCSESSGEKAQQQLAQASSFANTLTSSLSYALRFVSSGASTPRGGGSGSVGGWVYTVEVKDFESGATTKADLVVMENLFYNHKVDKTFDLKSRDAR